MSVELVRACPIRAGQSGSGVFRCIDVAAARKRCGKGLGMGAWVDGFVGSGSERDRSMASRIHSRSTNSRKFSEACLHHHMHLTNWLSVRPCRHLAHLSVHRRANHLFIVERMHARYTHLITATRAPSRARPSAIARPIPRAPPVTTALLFRKSNMVPKKEKKRK